MGVEDPVSVINVLVAGAWLIFLGPWGLNPVYARLSARVSGLVCLCILFISFVMFSFSGLYFLILTLLVYVIVPVCIMSLGGFWVIFFSLMLMLWWLLVRLLC